MISCRHDFSDFFPAYMEFMHCTIGCTTVLFMYYKLRIAETGRSGYFYGRFSEYGNDNGRLPGLRQIPDNYYSSTATATLAPPLGKYFARLNQSCRGRGHLFAMRAPFPATCFFDRFFKKTYFCITERGWLPGNIPMFLN